MFRYSVLRRLVDQASSEMSIPQLSQEHPIIRNLREYAKEVTP